LPKIRERLLESVRLACQWYVNTQNTEANPWGGVHDSADIGRYIYEYYVAKQWCRGMGVWGQALAIMGLLTAQKLIVHQPYDLNQSALLAGEYLKTLQVMDQSNPKVYGAMHEHTPLTGWSYPRDAATGGLGFIALYRHTKKEEFLHRALLFAQWYHDHGSDANGWPYNEYHFINGPRQEVLDPPVVKGDWQAGGGLVYYYLYKLTGEQRWIEYFRQLIDPLVVMYERNINSPVVSGFHGDVEITFGNDDFAIVALLAAYRHWHEPRMLKALQGHIRRLWTIADEDGTYPSYGGTFVCTINNHEYLKLCQEEKLNEDIAALEQRILKSALKSLEQQETRMQDVRAYGGFYGQSHYGVSRDCIHHRSTGYSIIMNTRLIGGVATPNYSSWGWEQETMTAKQ